RHAPSRFHRPCAPASCTPRGSASAPEQRNHRHRPWGVSSGSRAGKPARAPELFESCDDLANLAEKDAVGPVASARAIYYTGPLRGPWGRRGPAVERFVAFTFALKGGTGSDIHFLRETSEGDRRSAGSWCGRGSRVRIVTPARLWNGGRGGGGGRGPDF